MNSNKFLLFSCGLLKPQTCATNTFRVYRYTRIHTIHIYVCIICRYVYKVEKITSQPLHPSWIYSTLSYLLLYFYVHLLCMCVCTYFWLYLWLLMHIVALKYFRHNVANKRLADRIFVRAQFRINIYENSLMLLNI